MNMLYVGYFFLWFYENGQKMPYSLKSAFKWLEFSCIFLHKHARQQLEKQAFLTFWLRIWPQKLSSRYHVISFKY